jgi:hypothetical protein
MEKAKSLLIYYSNRFLNAKLDEQINNSFGNIFKQFNKIKDVAETYSISLITQKNFTEDSVMRYHFLAYENEYYDYNATVNDVLEIFLKSTLKALKSNSAELEKFIKEYISDLEAFFIGLSNLLSNCCQKKYYKIFSILDISTYLYPLTIRLEMKGSLNKQLSKYPEYTFLDLIETADVRVYKTRGTDPIKDISFLAKDSTSITDDDIESRLFNFIGWFMNDSEFKNRLNTNIYGNRALKHMFIEYDEYLLIKDQLNEYTLNDLIELNNTTPTTEHIFPQEAPFSLPNKGFNTEQDYLNQIHRLGNLLILEKSINSQCKNHIPDKKIVDTKLYSNSKFLAVQKFTAEQKNAGVNFDSCNIDERTIKLSDFCLKRWMI